MSNRTSNQRLKRFRELLVEFETAAGRVGECAYVLDPYVNAYRRQAAECRSQLLDLFEETLRPADETPDGR